MTLKLSGSPGLRARRNNLTGGADGSVGLRDVLALVPTDDLAGLFGDLVALRALAEGAAAAVLAEALSRGVVAASDDLSLIRI